MNDSAPTCLVIRSTWISLTAALALIALGALAALLPYAVGVAVGMMVIWVVVFSALAHLVHAWEVGGDLFLWRLQAGLLLVSAGCMRRRHGSGWLALDGAGALVFAALLFAAMGWALPWLLGLVVGFNVVASGLVFLALLQQNGLTARRLAS